MKRTIFLFMWVFLTLSMFSLTGCKNNGTSPTESEESWSDENVDNNAWT